MKRAMFVAAAIVATFSACAEKKATLVQKVCAENLAAYSNPDLYVWQYQEVWSDGATRFTGERCEP